MTLRPFRFAVNISADVPGEDWRAKCRKAEDLGYDVMCVCDYVDRRSPFVALAAAAAATKHAAVGTYVLNAGLYRPALLARDVAALVSTSGGRFELGIGTGYAKADFEAADVPWTSGTHRIAHLERTIAQLRESGPGAGYKMMIGGNGRAVLELAARTADIVSTTGALSRIVRGKPELADYAAIAGRAELIKVAAGARASEIDVNLLVHMVVPAESRKAALPSFRQYAPHLSDEDLLRLPTLLGGTPQQMAGHLAGARETLGFSYFTVLEPAMGAMAEVIGLLR